MSLIVKNLTINPPIACAPMVGLSHSALRSLILSIGGVGMLFTEMLSAKRLPNETERSSPLLIRTKTEKPLIYQIYASPESDIERAVEKLHALEAQGIDINLGCPAPNLKRLGAGQELLANLSETGTILKRARKKTHLPVSVKVRIGSSADTGKLLDLCRLFQDEGVDFITIHARLDSEKFCRKPRWQLVGEITPRIQVPIFVNGGIFTVSDAKQCLERSGAAGLMIGRGGVIKPWLFREVAESLYGIKFIGRTINREKIYLEFISLLEKNFPEERILGRLKQFTHYYAENYKFGHHFASKIQRSKSVEEAKDVAQNFFLKAA